MSREEVEGVRVAIGGAVAVDEVEDLSFATRWAVAGSSADICMGGIATGDFGFRGFVEDKVLKHQ